MATATRALTLACLACAASLATAPSHAGSDPVSLAAAAVRNASGKLRMGTDVAAGQVVRTGPGERVDIVFPDGSSLALAPNAEAMIEAFSYSPRQGTGHLVVRLAGGLFRFTGGRIAKQAAATVDTPAATLTARDGIVLIRVEAARTIATVTAGTGVTVSNGNGAQVLHRPGWQVIAEAGSPPGQPFAAPAHLLASELAALEAGPRPSGAAMGASESTEATNSAANKALSDVNILLQKSPANGIAQGMRGHTP